MISGLPRLLATGNIYGTAAKAILTPPRRAQTRPQSQIPGQDTCQSPPPSRKPESHADRGRGSRVSSSCLTPLVLTSGSNLGCPVRGRKHDCPRVHRNVARQPPWQQHPETRSAPTPPPKSHPQNISSGADLGQSERQLCISRCRWRLDPSHTTMKGV